MYRLRILDEAIRELAQPDKLIARRIVDRINWLAVNVDSLRLEALAGDLSRLYKLRVSEYRAIYEIVHNERIVVIHAIGHRREVYRKR